MGIISCSTIRSDNNIVDANLFKDREFEITSEKGDIWVDNGIQLVRLHVGTQNQKLVVDINSLTGLKWEDSGSIIGQVTFSSPITPTTLIAAVNNYNPTGLNTSNIL